MNCYCMIGDKCSFLEFQNKIKKLSYDFYQWPSCSLRQKKHEKCIILIEDLTKFIRSESKYFSFVKMTDSYEEVNLFFRFDSYRFESFSLLQNFFIDRGYPVKIIHTPRKKIQLQYSLYFGSYRDWLYGLVNQKRFENIVLIMPESLIKQELQFWKNEEVIVSTNIQSSQVDIILMNAKQLYEQDISKFKILFYHPSVNDLSWQLIGCQHHIYLHTPTMRFMQRFPTIFASLLLRFYKYRLLC